MKQKPRSLKAINNELVSRIDWLRNMLNDERTRVNLLEKEIEIRKMLPTIDKGTLSSINIANERVSDNLAHVIQYLISKLPK